MTRVVTFTDGFTSASAPDISSGFQEDFVLLNNQSITDMTGLLFSSTEVKSVVLDFELNRIGSTQYRQTGSIIAQYNGSWSIQFGNFVGDEIIQDTLVNTWSVTISINSSTGQIRYSTGNQTGHTSSEFKIIANRIYV